MPAILDEQPHPLVLGVAVEVRPKQFPILRHLIPHVAGVMDSDEAAAAAEGEERATVRLQPT